MELDKDKESIEDYHNRLVPVLDVSNLSAHFVAARIYDVGDEEGILSNPTARGKATMVLGIINRSIYSHTKDFYSMLHIMIAYGNGANQALAQEIMSETQIRKAKKVQKKHEIDESTNSSSSIQGGIEYIKNIVGGQFTEQEMIEALQHTKINAINALDYLLKKGTESVDTPEMPSKVSDKKERKIPKEILKYTEKDLQEEVKVVLPKFNNNILYEHIYEDQKIIEGVLLLLMVVNPNEFHATMNYFSKSEAQILNSGGNNYYVGKWGQIPAALVQQGEQGTGGPCGAQQLTCSSIDLFRNLKVIIALGVCGTMGRLGDVIVSSRIDGCNLLKIKDNRIINRALVCRPGKNIRGFLMLGSGIWCYQCTKQGSEVHEAKAEFKPMLSGTPLIADGEYRDKLLDNVSQDAGGVEMEGIGVVEGIDVRNRKDSIEFIIVKAGCDYADEEKNKEWQPVAAMAAADFVYKQLDKTIVHNWFFKGKPDKPLIEL